MTTTGTQSNEQAIYADLTGTLGLSDQAAFGVLGNFQVESGFSPTAYNAGEGAIGIAQWEGGRRSDGLDPLAASMGQPETSLSAQLAYLNQELGGSFAGVLSQLRQPGITTQQAAEVFDTQYEISTPDTIPLREQDAAALAAGGNVNTGAGNTATLASAGSVISRIGSDISNFLPWNYGKDLSSAQAGLANVFISFGLKALFLVGGVTLVVMGAYRASAPARDKASDTAQSLAPLAAAAA